MKIITKQLAEKLPPKHKLLSNQEVNPKNYLALCSVLTKTNELFIYDLTTTKTHNKYTIICVNDHINRTGNNLLIGHQKELDIDFIEISGLYKREKNAVKTDCCGKTLNPRYQYPSHYLCNVSILARAIGIQKISAFLINFP